MPEKIECTPGHADKCQRAQSTDCDCACGGQNHGKQQTLGIFGGVRPKVGTITAKQFVKGKKHWKVKPFAKWVKVNGEVVNVQPKGRKFKFEELKKFIGGGLVQIVPLPHGEVLVCDDEGKLKGFHYNHKATEMWKRAYPIEKFPINNDELVVGDVLFAKRGQV